MGTENKPGEQQKPKPDQDMPNKPGEQKPGQDKPQDMPSQPY